MAVGRTAIGCGKFTPFITVFILLVGQTTITCAQTTPPKVIGYLGLTVNSPPSKWYAAFKAGLAENGWNEGRDYRIEDRWANFDPARLEPMARELASYRPDVIVGATNQAVAIAAKILPTTPIVQANGGDPVAAGFAASLAKPGGMITGMTNVIGDVSEKSLELLMAAIPRLKRIGFLHGPGPVGEQSVAAAKRGLAHYGVQGEFAEATTPQEIELALSLLAKRGAQALVILSGSTFPNQRQLILRVARENRWPVIGGLREYAESGALLAYGANREALYRRAAFHVTRILKGAYPGDLPFEQPTKFELVLNMKTAKELKIKVPGELLMRADSVIE